jgi:putative nucleotidyltransferase with HDIG domain
MWFFRKKSPRRSKVRKTITGEKFAQISRFATAEVMSSALLGLVFIAACVFIFSFEIVPQDYERQVLPITGMVALITLAAGVYINHYQNRIIKNLTRAAALVGLFILLLAMTKLGILLTGHTLWATGGAVTVATILTIAYDQRFAIGMSVFYCMLACFSATPLTDISLFLTMLAGAFTCCFSLKEIRTRNKLFEVGAVAAAVVLITSVVLDFLVPRYEFRVILLRAGLHAIITLGVGFIIQGLLPVIEKIFRIATSMTLLDYSDANQPLLKRLAMEAPGTYSHSILIGSIAEAAAEAIGCNGLMCRVGAYYHDIGKINKPTYFVENEMGSISRHKELSPAMSQLIIVGHVKDGIEMAKEFKLPSVLRQFIETHHGTTLVEYFYNEAVKKADEKQSPPSESEFRYAGPKPRTKEAAIVMLADTVESAARSLPEVTPTKVEAVVHNMAMKRLQDGQFDECDMSLRELSQIETSVSQTLAAHYHGRVAYPKPPDVPDEKSSQDEQTEQKTD